MIFRKGADRVEMEISVEATGKEAKNLYFKKTNKTAKRLMCGSKEWDDDKKFKDLKD
jgi:hypothetical protein